MDPLTATLAVAGVAKAGASIYDGYNRASDMRFQASEQERRARAIDLQAKQDAAARYSELDTAMQTIMALRGARGIGFDSPTAIAIDKGVQKQAREGMLMARLGFVQDADSARITGRQLMKGAKRSIISGYIGAAGGAADVFSAFNQPKPAPKRAA